MPRVSTKGGYNPLLQNAHNFLYKVVEVSNTSSLYEKGSDITLPKKTQVKTLAPQVKTLNPYK